MTNNHDWRPLSELPEALGDLRGSFPTDGELEDAISNAILSSQVPVRGRPFNAAHPNYDCRLARPASAFAPLSDLAAATTAKIKLQADFVSIRACCYLRAESDTGAVRRWLRENAVPKGASVSVPRPQRGGRPPVIDWGMVEKECSRLMDYNGPFSDDDPEWSCQADMERAIHGFIMKKFNKTLAESVIRSRVSIFLASS